MTDNPRYNHPRSLSTSAVEDEIQREKVKNEMSASSYKTPQRSNSNRTPTNNKRSISAYNYEDYDGEYSTDDAAVFLSAKKLFGTNIREETFDKFIQKRRHALESQRASISIYTSPLLVLSYFILYMYHQTRLALIYLFSRTDLLAGILATSGLLYLLGHVEGFHTAVSNERASGRADFRHLTRSNQPCGGIHIGWFSESHLQSVSALVFIHLYSFLDRI